jgi:DNA-binding MarR family transcriptional regulator
MAARDEIPLALRSAYLALHRRTETQFASYGVTADQFVLLATLAHGDVLTQRELARRMPSDPSTVRAMLVLLERNGLVQRDSHPTDARARTVALTVAGQLKFRQLWSASESIRSQMFDSLQSGEAETLARFLTQIAEALSADFLPVVGSTSTEIQGDEI